MISRAPTTLVCSFGGVGTTTVLDFLSTVPELSVNPPRGFRNPLKHPLAPPDLPSVERAVFLFGCPTVSLLSLFRRGNASLHYVNINNLIPEDLPYPTRDPWRLTVERFGLHESERPGVWVDEQGRYASNIGALDWLEQQKTDHQRLRAAAEGWVEETARAAFSDLDDYLASGIDHLRRHEQIRAWDEGAKRYPILHVRYEALWDRRDQVLDFLQVPARYRGDFPQYRTRQSSVDREPAARQKGLRKMHSELQDRLAAKPDLHVIETTG